MVASFYQAFFEIFDIFSKVLWEELVSGWHEYMKGFCWLIGSWLVYDVFGCLLNLTPLYTFVFKKVISISDISAVNLIVEWKLFAFFSNILALYFV